MTNLRFHYINSMLTKAKEDVDNYMGFVMHLLFFSTYLIANLFISVNNSGIELIQEGNTLRGDNNIPDMNKMAEKIFNKYHEGSYKLGTDMIGDEPTDPIFWVYYMYFLEEQAIQIKGGNMSTFQRDEVQDGIYHGTYRCKKDRLPGNLPESYIGSVLSNLVETPKQRLIVDCSRHLYSLTCRAEETDGLLHQHEVIYLVRRMCLSFKVTYDHERNDYYVAIAYFNNYHQLYILIDQQLTYVYLDMKHTTIIIDEDPEPLSTATNETTAPGAETPLPGGTDPAPTPDVPSAS